METIQSFVPISRRQKNCFLGNPDPQICIWMTGKEKQITSLQLVPPVIKWKMRIHWGKPKGVVGVLDILPNISPIAGQTTATDAEVDGNVRWTAEAKSFTFNCTCALTCFLTDILPFAAKLSLLLFLYINLSGLFFLSDCCGRMKWKMNASSIDVHYPTTDQIIRCYQQKRILKQLLDW